MCGVWYENIRPGPDGPGLICFQLDDTQPFFELNMYVGPDGPTYTVIP